MNTIFLLHSRVIGLSDLISILFEAVSEQALSFQIPILRETAVPEICTGYRNTGLHFFKVGILVLRFVMRLFSPPSRLQYAPTITASTGS